MKPLRIILSALLIASAGLCKARTVGAWSLDSCISRAISANIDVRAAILDGLESRQGITEAKDRFLPTLNAQAAQNWDFGRSLSSENTYANRNTSTFGWGAQLQLPLFQGLSAVRSLRQAREAARASGLRARATQDQAALATISYYLQALYNRELLAVSREQLHLAATQLERQQSLLEAGKVPEADVIQARAQVATCRADTVEASNTLRLSLVELATFLELPDPDGFDILPLDTADTDPALLAASLPPRQAVLDRALSGYSSILAAEAGIRVADKAIDVAKSGYLPRLSFGAGISDSYYHMTGMPNNSFSRQMRDNLSKNIGFSLSIPIFDAFSTRNAVRRARLSKLSAELELDRSRSQLRSAILQAYTQAEGAVARYEATQTSVEATRTALEAMTEKYTYGKANATEWQQAQSDYITALSRRVQARYETILRQRILEFYYR